MLQGNTMFKKIALVLLSLVLGLVCVGIYFHQLGSGQQGVLHDIKPIPQQTRPITKLVSPTENISPSEILFGDLHVHTGYSADAALFNLPELSGFGGTTPADACNYARYCSAIDFWSINDHAEDLSPRSWNNTVAAIEACNAVTNESRPDLVSFLGWEWSQRSGNVTSHYGHKNVILREYKVDEVPTRPIAAHNQSFVIGFPQAIWGYLKMGNKNQAYDDFNALMQDISSTPICDDNTDVRSLPDTCREVALTPTKLYEKLDQWGNDHIIIPHGLAWGTTNPEGADLKNQLDEHDPDRQRLLEVYSGHGSSERFINTANFLTSDEGEISCPETSDDYSPCCRQAGELVKAQCDDANTSTCQTLISDAQRKVAGLYAEGKTVNLADIGGKTLADWGQCGQLKDFMPAYDYRAKQSAQYAYALNGDLDDNIKGLISAVDEKAKAKPEGKVNRYRFGLIGSSDNHKARAGNGYKEGNRLMITDTKDVGVVKNQLLRSFTSKREGSFYYSGGLVAAHSKGRDRDAIWQSLNNRQVYGTSGDRILLWFDLLNSDQGKIPMGSETYMTAAPKFHVKALGAFEQIPGCPDYAKDALGEKGVENLCGGECYNPGDSRKKITRIEVVRIFPQQSADESISGLIEDPWKSYECPEDSEGCSFSFEDTDYATSQREVLYYVRAIQAPSLAVNGDPFGCERDSDGNCITVNYCVGPEADRAEDCLNLAAERAWSSPIFIEPKEKATQAQTDISKSTR